MRKQLFCNELWLTIFCTHALLSVPTIWTMCLQYIIIILLINLTWNKQVKRTRFLFTARFVLIMAFTVK